MHAVVLAVSLVTTPFEEWTERKAIEAALPHIRQYWLSTDLMEECEYLFKSPWMLEQDQATLEWRLENTPDDAPPIVARHALPASDVALKNYVDAINYGRHLRLLEPWLLEGDERNILWALIDDTQRRENLWYQVYKCSSDNYWGREGRRMALAELRRMAGDDAFLNGNWPPALPPSGYLESNWRDQKEEEIPDA